MGMGADLGTGITIEFLTSGFSAEVLDVQPPGASRETFDASHQGSGVNPGAGKWGNKPFLFSRLVDAGEASFDIHFDPDDVPPLHAAAEQIRITFPVPTGLSTGAQWTFSGGMTGYQPTGPLDGKMTASVTIKVSGAVTRVVAA